MKKRNLTLVLALTIMASIASADICGITKTAQGRTAANIIDAQAKQSTSKKAKLLDSSTMQTYEVVDALVSNKDGFELSDGKYFDFKVTLPDGQKLTIDIGYTYVVLADGKTAVSLDQLTGCGGIQKRAIIDISELSGARADD